MKGLKKFGAQALAVAAMAASIIFASAFAPAAALAMAVALPTRGRLIKVRRGDSPLDLVAGVRTRSVTINGEPIDVTSDDDSGWRKLLDAPAEMQVSISVSGILKNELLLQESLSTTDRVKATEFAWPGNSTEGKLAGDFYLSSFTITGEYNGAPTFDAEFQSTGEVTFVPAT